MSRQTRTLVEELLEKNGIELSKEAVEKLASYAEEVVRWGARMNLVGAPDSRTVVCVHLADSIAAIKRFQFSGSRCVDIGSGAGFPGLPIGLAVDDARVTLIEARKKRAAFLKYCIANFGLLNVEVFGARAEDYPHHNSFDYAFSRATGDETSVWRVARQLLAGGGKLLMWKSIEYDTRVIERLKGAGARLEEVVDEAIGMPAGAGYTRREVRLVVVRKTSEV